MFQARHFDLMGYRCVALFIITVLSFAGLPSAHADNHGRQTGRIDAEQLQQIQFVSHGVLAAKHNAAPDPEVEGMRQRFAELRDAIDELRRVDLPTVTAPVVQLPSTAGGNAVVKSLGVSGSQPPTADSKPAENKIRELLGKLKNHRTGIEQRSKPHSDERSELVAHDAAQKTHDLESEIEAAMSAAPMERAAQLAELRKRLTPTRLNDVVVIDRQPTLSTLTQHRE